MGKDMADLTADAIEDMHGRLKFGMPLTVEEQRQLWNVLHSVLVTLHNIYNMHGIATDRTFIACGKVEKPKARCEECNCTGKSPQTHGLERKPCPACEGSGFVERG
jgi:hypothetical protein